MLLALIVVSSADILKHRNRYSFGTVQLTWFMVGAWFTLTAVYVFCYMEILDRVNVLVFVLALPVLALWLTENCQWRYVGQRLAGTLKGLIAGLTYGVTLVVVLSNFVGWWFVPVSPQKKALLTVTTQLVDAGYYQGYGSMWQANVLTELSNGALEVWCWGQPDWINGYADSYDTLDHVWPWLQAVDHVKQYPTGKVFMIFTNDETQRYTIPAQLATVPEYTFYDDEYYVVYTFNSVNELQNVLCT